MLLSAYPAYGLSHFDYSAVVLMSCTAADKAEMTHFQHQILKIIGITADVAAASHNVLPIIAHIDKVCTRVFERIISDPAHPIIASLPVNVRKPEQFVVPKARTSTYQNSFLVIHLRSRRDGVVASATE